MSKTTVVPDWLKDELEANYTRLRVAVAALEDDAGDFERHRLSRSVAHMALTLKALDPERPTLTGAVLAMAEAMADISSALESGVEAVEAQAAGRDERP